MSHVLLKKKTLAATATPTLTEERVVQKKLVIRTEALSDGFKQLSLFVELVVNGKILRGKVIPPKGTSDGFHEALDSKEPEKDCASLWAKVEDEIKKNPSLLDKPETLCEMIDEWGGWKTFGAQASLAVREMLFKLSAQYQGVSLIESKHNAYNNLGGFNDMAYAIPQMVMLSAAKHGNGIKEVELSTNPWDTSINKVVQGLPWQEWMVQFAFVNSADELLNASAEFHDILYWLLRERGDAVTKLSKEGGMTVNNVRTPYEIVNLYKEAVTILGTKLGQDLQLGKDVFLAIDGACSEAYFPESFIYDYSSLKVIKEAGVTCLDVIEGQPISLNREQHYVYTEHVRATKGRLADFKTDGLYHIVLSNSEAETFMAYLDEQIPMVTSNYEISRYVKINDLTIQELESHDLAKAGYRKFALSSLQQVLLMKHLKDSTGNVFSSIEDLMAEDDWDGYVLASKILDGTQLVGDDWWVTNPGRMVRAYRLGILNAIPLIKENQVADPWKAINMIVLSEHVQYLNENGQREFILEVVNKSDYDNLDSVATIRKLIAELHEKVVELGLPIEPIIGAVVSHRSKSYGPDVDAALAGATGSTGKLGPYAIVANIMEWEAMINPYEPALLTRIAKHTMLRNAVHDRTIAFNAKSVPGVTY